MPPAIRIKIGESIPLLASTANSVGAASDASTAPSFRIYGATDTAIVTGTIPKKDDANTLGFYASSVTATSGSYTAGSSYYVYIQAVSDSKTAVDGWSFIATERDLDDLAVGAVAGAIKHTITITSSAGGAPLQGVEVTISTDINNADPIRSGSTDDNGEVIFYLDAGSYFSWRTKSGFDFTNPITETVA